MTNRQISWFLFAIGLLTDVRVHVVGMIGISEIVIVLCAPILFLKDFGLLKRNRVMPFCALIFMACVGCVVASIVNHTPFQNWTRGLATPVVLLASVIFLYHFMQKNPDGFRWFVCGYVMSGLFNFFLNGASFDSLMGEGTEMLGANTVAVTRMYILLPCVLLPVYVWYAKMPWIVSAAICALLGVFTILSTDSGRSASLSFFAAAFLIYLGRKSYARMATIKRRFYAFVLVGLVAVFALKIAYSYAASSGLLGERSRSKYERQTRSGSSIIKLLIAGRAEAFVCVYAALDKPLVGFGPWAVDEEGYYKAFWDKYGSDEDFIERMKSDAYRARNGLMERTRYIPVHSHIFGQWVWYGIFGLLLWVYALYLVAMYFRKYVDVMPQWYGIMALLLPRLCWDIFFSPLFARVETMAIMVAILISRAIYERRMGYDSETICSRMKFLNIR